MNLILQHGGYALTNAGDLSMLISTMEAVWKRCPAAEIAVLGSDSTRLARFVDSESRSESLAPREWLGTGLIGVRHHNKVPPALRGIARRIDDRVMQRHPSLNMARNPSRAIRAGQSLVARVARADILLCSGGGYINDVFLEIAASTLQMIGMAQAVGTRTAMLGQGIGPLTNARLIRLATRSLSRCEAIGLRAPAGSEILASLGVAPGAIWVTGDSALALSTGQNAYVDAIGVNIRIADYVGLPLAVGRSIVGWLEELPMALRRIVRPCPISFAGPDQDLSTLQTLFHGQPIQRRLSNRSDLEAAIEACRVRLMLTSSYHAAVFALAAGGSVVGLTSTPYYEYKFEGLRDLFGPEAVTTVNASPKDVKTLRSTILTAVEKAWDEAGRNRDQILMRAGAQVVEHDQLYDQLLKSSP